MSRQDIKTVREFNQWRRGGGEINLDKGYPAQLSRALDGVVVMAERYEAVRLLNPRQFAELYARNLAGEGAFDELVDELVRE